MIDKHNDDQNVPRTKKVSYNNESTLTNTLLGEQNKQDYIACILDAYVTKNPNSKIKKNFDILLNTFEDKKDIEKEKQEKGKFLSKIFTIIQKFENAALFKDSYLILLNNSLTKIYQEGKLKKFPIQQIENTIFAKKIPPFTELRNFSSQRKIQENISDEIVSKLLDGTDIYIDNLEFSKIDLGKKYFAIFEELFSEKNPLIGKTICSNMGKIREKLRRENTKDLANDLSLKEFFEFLENQKKGENLNEDQKEEIIKISQEHLSKELQQRIHTTSMQLSDIYENKINIFMKLLLDDDFDNESFGDKDENKKIENIFTFCFDPEITISGKDYKKALRTYCEKKEKTEKMKQIIHPLLNGEKLGFSQNYVNNLLTLGEKSAIEDFEKEIEKIDKLLKTQGIKKDLIKEILMYPYISGVDIHSISEFVSNLPDFSLTNLGLDRATDTLQNEYKELFIDFVLSGLEKERFEKFLSVVLDKMVEKKQITKNDKKDFSDNYTRNFSYQKVRSQFEKIISQISDKEEILNFLTQTLIQGKGLLRNDTFQKSGDMEFHKDLHAKPQEIIEEFDSQKDYPIKLLRTNAMQKIENTIIIPQYFMHGKNMLSAKIDAFLLELESQDIKNDKNIDDKVKKLIGDYFDSIPKDKEEEKNKNSKNTTGYLHKTFDEFMDNLLKKRSILYKNKEIKGEEIFDKTKEQTKNIDEKIFLNYIRYLYYFTEFNQNKNNYITKFIDSIEQNLFDLILDIDKEKMEKK